MLASTFCLDVTNSGISVPMYKLEFVIIIDPRDLILSSVCFHVIKHKLVFFFTVMEADHTAYLLFLSHLKISRGIIFLICY